MSLKEQQPALDIKQQIENLKNNQLIIEDEKAASDFLNDVSYFRLIKAYSLGLKDKNGPYRDQASFELIKELYLFNSSFRHLLFPQIERIEINLRCRLGNHFCLQYGVLGYLDENNFADLSRYNDFIEDVQKEIAYNARSPFVRNFQNNYIDGNLPFYALLEVMTFGTLSKLLQNLHSSDRKSIGQLYGVPYTYLESWVESIAYVRNVCAHYGRLYNAKLTKTPTLYEEYKKKGIHNYHIFSVLLCMKHLLPRDEHWLKFIDSLDALFKKYPHVQKRRMGFPDDWKTMLLDN